MKTIQLTQTTWDGRAVGGARQMVRLRDLDSRECAGAGKVIDLAAWRAENPAELEASQGDGAGPGGLAPYQGRELARRPRRKHDSALIKGELAATLSVAGLMVALIIRVLVF